MGGSLICFTVYSYQQDLLLTATDEQMCGRVSIHQAGNHDLEHLPCCGGTDLSAMEWSTLSVCTFKVLRSSPVMLVALSMISFLYFYELSR